MNASEDSGQAHELDIGHKRVWKIQYSWYHGKGQRKIAAQDLSKEAADEKEAHQSVHSTAKGR